MTSRRTLASLVLGFSLVFGAAGHASATTIVLFPDDDRRGVDAFLDGNFVLQLDMGLATVTRNMSFEERAAMEFALAPIPAGATVLSATLDLFLPVAPVAMQTGEVHGYGADGIVAATDLNATNLLTTFNVNALTVSIPIPPAFLQGLLAADEDYVGLVLRNMTVPTGVFQFYTMDSGFDQFNPRLTVEVDPIPEPATILLVLGGLAAVGPRMYRTRFCRGAGGSA